MSISQEVGMRWSEWFDKWSMKSLRVNAVLMQAEFRPNDVDKDAAWEMYIELLTRITTQQLKPNEGNEESALKSMYSLFGTTREILKEHGRGCVEFTK